MRYSGNRLRGELRHLVADTVTDKTVLHRHQMRHDEVYQALGHDPKRHLPDEGIPPTAVNGVTVYVLAKDDERRRRWFSVRRTGEKVSNMKGKRTYAVCPDCGTHVEAGHIHQHVMGRKCREAREKLRRLKGRIEMLEVRYKTPEVNRQYWLAQALIHVSSYEWRKVDKVAAQLTDDEVATFLRIITALNAE